jgi:hypothetical protein
MDYDVVGDDAYDVTADPVARDAEPSAQPDAAHLTGARDAARRAQLSEVPDLPPPDPEIARHIAEIRDQANLRQGSMRAHPTARRDD